MAARAGLARELFEETGIDVRGTVLEERRLQPAVLRHDNGSETKQLVNELKHRFFFVLALTDDDFCKVCCRHNFEHISRLFLYTLRVVANETLFRSSLPLGMFWFLLFTRSVMI